MKKSIIVCKKSFQLGSIGMLVFLKHEEKGLAQGSMLHCEATKEDWELEARMLCGHALEHHRIFKNEVVNYMRFSFENQEKRENAVSKIIAEEANHTYQYKIKPINHQNKPMEGAHLIFKSKQNL